MLTSNSSQYSIFVALLKLCGRANRIFVVRSISAVEALIKMGLPAPLLVHRVNEMIASQNKSLRQYASTFVLKFLEQGFVLLLTYFRGHRSARRRKSFARKIPFGGHSRCLTRGPLKCRCSV